MSYRRLIAEGRALQEHVFQLPQDYASPKGVYSINPWEKMTYAEPSFPWRTRAAAEVFEVMKQLTVEQPEVMGRELVKLALNSLPYTFDNLTPEDLQLLQIGLDVLQVGPPKAHGLGDEGRPSPSVSFGWIGMGERSPVRSQSLVESLFGGGTSIPTRAQVSAGGGSQRWFEVPKRIEPPPSPEELEKRSQTWQATIDTIRSGLRALRSKRGNRRGAS